MIPPFEKPIYVTRPFLPPLEEFCKGLEEIRQNAWLTNNGPVLTRYTREPCHCFTSEDVCWGQYLTCRRPPDRLGFASATLSLFLRGLWPARD